jgi:hypothetical protein
VLLLREWGTWLHNAAADNADARYRWHLPSSNVFRLAAVQQRYSVPCACAANLP